MRFDHETFHTDNAPACSACSGTCTTYEIERDHERGVSFVEAYCAGCGASRRFRVSTIINTARDASAFDRAREEAAAEERVEARNREFDR